MAVRTPNEIILDAIERAGNVTITSQAQVWLNNLLDRLYEDYRWPWLETVATGTVAVGQTDIPLPPDFSDLWNRHGLKLIDPSTGAEIVLVPMTPDEYDDLVNPNLEGQPQRVKFDKNTMTWTPWPLPGKVYNYRIRYRAKPAQIVDFDLDPILFPPDEILTQYVYTRALQHEDDDRYPAELEIFNNQLARYLKQFNLSPIKDQRLSYRSDTFRPMGTYR